ncbi:hypothetical protein GOP47_0014301 [Adiantum capillus-veneris]|uniref:Uncharacterized protein n=1 Tax=Adiantum capillus-veneris TaxID=13818 RepID=A0A9D4UL73_ADICA|nr:hypothetical protein GOP47_0014301 [Adiantum capillus-veneris]
MKVALLAFALLLSVLCAAIANNNITDILASHPSHSTLSRLCKETGVAAAIFSRSTITVLVPPDSVLDPIVHQYSSDSNTMYDVTTGQAAGQDGFVNIAVKGNTIHIACTNGGMSIVISVFSISTVLIPNGISAPGPAAAALVNFTEIFIQVIRCCGHFFWKKK